MRVVGLEDRVVVDYVQGDLQVGDVFVLLTDGVWGSLNDKRLQAMAHVVPDASSTCNHPRLTTTQA